MSQVRTFPAVPESVRDARRFAAAALPDLPRSTFESIELMISELATNSVKHGEVPFELSIDCSSAEVRVEVRDSDQGTPTMRSPGPDEPTGRGLQIVNMLADAWGIERVPGDGKTVWLTVATG